MRDVKVLLLMTYPTNFISVDLDESAMGMMSTRYTDREEVAAIGGERRGEGMAAGRGGVRSNDRLQRAGGTHSFRARLRTVNTCWDGERIRYVDELVSHLLRRSA